jgi:hypothetical protein
MKSVYQRLRQHAAQVAAPQLHLTPNKLSDRLESD